jgi:tetratricopeptide (TPR) repeat protein
MRLGLVSLILVLAFAAPARGQTEAARRAEARALVLQGVKLFEQGDYQTAVERFEEAYARFPTPNILYNLAQGYRELGRDVAAIEAYERFVQEAPGADAETLREARQAAAGLRQRVGSLEMTCDVAGASRSCCRPAHTRWWWRRPGIRLTSIASRPSAG